MKRFYHLRYLLRVQGPLLGLILLLVCIHVVQIAGPINWDEQWMMVPEKVVESSHRLREGNLSAADWKVFSTMFTCEFLHADPGHLMNNLLFLWIFAALAVELLGYRWMFLIYFVTAFTASLLHTALNYESPIPTLGASGALMGFEGAYLGLVTRFHLPDPHIWPMARPVPPIRMVFLGAMSLCFDLMGMSEAGMSNVAHGAHIGGFVGGLFLTALFAPLPKNAWPRRN